MEEQQFLFSIIIGYQNFNVCGITKNDSNVSA